MIWNGFPNIGTLMFVKNSANDCFFLPEAAAVVGIASNVAGMLDGGDKKKKKEAERDRQFQLELQRRASTIPDYAMKIIKQYLMPGATPEPTYSGQVKGMTQGASDPAAYANLMQRLNTKYASPQGGTATQYLNAK